MKKFCVLLAACMVTTVGCQLEPGANRGPAFLRPIGDAADTVSSTVLGSYQEQFNADQSTTMKAAALVINEMRLAPVSSSEAQM